MASPETTTSNRSDLGVRNLLRFTIYTGPVIRGTSETSGRFYGSGRTKIENNDIYVTSVVLFSRKIRSRCS